LLEEVHYLDALVLGLVDACDVLEGDPGVPLFIVASGAASAETAEGTPEASLRRGAPRQPHEQADQEQGRAETEEQTLPQAARLLERLGLDLDPFVDEHLLQTRVGEGWDRGGEPGSGARVVSSARRVGHGFLEGPFHGVATGGDLLYVTCFYLVPEEGV